ncbi:MAG: alpha/beta hydrolase [Rhodospirillaceae bacterium]|jgi:pimeloyl-ACP methyl ester carboxylesterase|nr:alpha/beta hydrolase [Rhodospirillaceae bacterium]MBT5665896.1 alpha/beta hydrolase [Rhodospirillaceae bacterium]
MNAYRERRYTAQDGLSLYYRVYGHEHSGSPAILCLPGLTRNSKDFHGVASHFCDRYVVYCPDYRGRGQSDYDANAENYAPSTYLNDLRHLLVLNGLHRVVVIGTSLGGLLGMAMSVAMPTAVAGLVMNDIGPNVEGLSSIIDYVRVDRPQTNWADAAAELRLRFPDLSLQNECDWIDAAKATWREGADGLLHFDWDVALIKPILRQSPIDLWPLFSALRRLPVLAVRGEKSKVISQITFDKMAGAHPDLQQVTVANVGHAPSLREPMCLDALGNFMDRISSG